MQRGFANKQTTRNLAGVLRSKKGAKTVPAKTKLEDARGLKHSDNGDEF